MKILINSEANSESITAVTCTCYYKSPSREFYVSLTDRFSPALWNRRDTLAHQLKEQTNVYTAPSVSLIYSTHSLEVVFLSYLYIKDTASIPHAPYLKTKDPETNHSHPSNIPMESATPNRHFPIPSRTPSVSVLQSLKRAETFPSERSLK